MAFIEPLPEEQVDDRVQDLYEADRERFGFVPNFTHVFARRPEVYQAWKQLNGAIKEAMGARRYELATLAAARRLRSSYCMLAHGKVLADSFLGTEALRQVAEDHRAAGLDPVDVAVMDLAEKVAGDAAAMSDADVAPLRDLGLSDDEILDVVLAAAARAFFSKTLDALGLQADAAYAELEPKLREVLTVGRPISAAA
jgi:uncharacterized peroxidase-related enzyme